MTDYFSTLRDRRGRAILPEIVDVKFENGDSPVLGKCHENADRWALENEGSEAVRGWLVMSYGFERHSIVRSADGALLEITIPRAYPFLFHQGPQADFDRIGELGFNQVLWSRIPD